MPSSEVTWQEPPTKTTNRTTLLTFHPVVAGSNPARLTNFRCQPPADTGIVPAQLRSNEAGPVRPVSISHQSCATIPQGTPTVQDLIGRRLGHYRIVEKIDEGGMGEVCLAVDAVLDWSIFFKQKT